MNRQKIIDVVRKIRKADTGAWLKECSVVSRCSEGTKERQKLMRLLDELYKVVE